jgi:hypothetical protein
MRWERIRRSIDPDAVQSPVEDQELALRAANATLPAARHPRRRRHPTLLED